MTSISHNIFGTLSSAPNGGIVDHIFNYISIVLQDFHADIDENENAITNRFCIVLGQRKPVDYPYFFHHQNLEDDSANTSTDFAVFGVHPYSDNDTALLKFEAKRLTNLPIRREREYVIGEYDNTGNRTKNSGGIERFKNGRHGQDVMSAGLIGYVQTESFDTWHDKINTWIKEEIKKPHDTSLTWDAGDILSLESIERRIAFYNSAPTRIKNHPIRLRHIWVAIQQNK